VKRKIEKFGTINLVQPFKDENLDLNWPRSFKRENIIQIEDKLQEIDIT